jgi:acetylornithine/succinyldiaminopimelate/putrescine aminotransferase
MDPTLQTLAQYESRNVTFMEADGSWPIVWDRARGVHIWDATGKKYLDLTAAFGVANAGHANLRVIRAATQQAKRLLHAMGDVHPHPRKAELVRKLSELTFERWNAGRARTILCNSGFEAVEAALKTALLVHPNRPRIIAFEGGYHGLGYGALNATHRSYFREPFRNQLANFATAISFPQTNDGLAEVEKQIRAHAAPSNAILVEPIQARGGIRVPPDSFLPLLRKLCDELGLLLILDEIYTGFGRTGKWFACEHSQTVPDLICLGKALTGGFPLSACVGKSEIMGRAWPPSPGEALHTSTFLGHPVGCAMALAQIAELDSIIGSPALAEKSAFLLKALPNSRGRGLMVGFELERGDEALRVIKNLLHRGFVFLPEGEHANVIAFTPPLTITIPQLRRAIAALKQELAELK